MGSVQLTWIYAHCKPENDQNKTNVVRVLVTFIKLFLLLTLFNFLPIRKQKNEQDTMDMQLLVHTENTDKLSSCKQFMLWCSAHKLI
jgi:hypothetical protein